MNKKAFFDVVHHFITSPLEFLALNLTAISTEKEVTPLEEKEEEETSVEAVPLPDGTDGEEPSSEDQSSEEELTVDELEDLEATEAGGESDARDGHGGIPVVTFGQFSSPNSVPRTIGIDSQFGGSFRHFEPDPFAIDENLIPMAFDDMNMAFEPDRKPCNLVIIIDVSKSMQGMPLDLEKQAVIEMLTAYESLGVPLNITVIPFASNIFVRAVRTEQFGDDVEDAIDFIDDLTIFFQFLGPETEYDDAIREAKDVLEDDLYHLPEEFEHKVLFFSDGEPTEQLSNSEEMEWQEFIDENNINVVPIAIKPDGDDMALDEAYGPVQNPGDTIIVINNENDIEEVYFPNLPAPPIHLDGNLLDNDKLGDPPTLLIALCFHAETMEQVEFYTEQVEGATFTLDNWGYIVNVPVGAGVEIMTLLGGKLSVNEDGGYEYWGPAINIPSGNLFEHFSYKIQDGNGDVSSADVELILKDTAPMAFDNAAYLPAYTGEMYVLSDFSNGFSGWSQSGHEHSSASGQPSETAFLSTRNVHESVTSENTLANILDLPSSALDDVTGFNAREGSIIYRDVELNPGDMIFFDYIFGTRDPFEIDDNDFAFLSLSLDDHYVVYDFADTNHPSMSSSNDMTMDSTDWTHTTGWQSDSFEVPLDWQIGTYRLGFGVMDVGFPYRTRNDASMLVLDNIKIMEGVTSVSGNVITDPNEDVMSDDPFGAADKILADGGKVSEIYFDALEDGEDYIDDNDLDELDAYADGNIVHIPIPMDGEEIIFETPKGGILVIDKFGSYTYYTDNDEGGVSEQFTYVLSEALGDDMDTANLTICVTEELLPDYAQNGSNIYDFDLGEDPSKLHISGLDDHDVLNFYSVVDANEPIGGAGQPDIDDAIMAWLQDGDNVVIKLANSTKVVLEDIGMVADAGDYSSALPLQTHLEDTLDIMVNINTVV